MKRGFLEVVAVSWVKTWFIRARTWHVMGGGACVLGEVLRLLKLEASGITVTPIRAPRIHQPP